MDRSNIQIDSNYELLVFNATFNNNWIWSEYGPFIVIVR